MEKAKDGSPGFIGFLKQVFKDFSEDRCPRLAASIAYYTIFALPPLLVFVIMILSVFVDPQQIQGAISQQITKVVGPQGGQMVQTMIQNAQRPNSGSTWTVVLSILALVFSASGAFLSLQGALNVAWEVRPDPQQSGLKRTIFKRLVSLGLVLVVAFLLLVALLVNGGAAAAGGLLADVLPTWMSSFVIMAINWAFFLGLFTVLYAIVFKVLPDASVDWNDVWVGSAVTAFLFVLEQVALGIYFRYKNPGGAFGAAGSLAAILLWVYITALITLLGAEFTQRWARIHGKRVRPESGAVRFRIELIREESEHPPSRGAR